MAQKTGNLNYTKVNELARVVYINIEKVGNAYMHAALCMYANADRQS